MIELNFLFLSWRLDNPYCHTLSCRHCRLGGCRKKSSMHCATTIQELFIIQSWLWWSMYSNFVPLSWKFGNPYYHTLCRHCAAPLPAGWLQKKKLNALCNHYLSKDVKSQSVFSVVGLTLMMLLSCWSGNCFLPRDTRIQIRKWVLHSAIRMFNL